MSEFEGTTRREVFKKAAFVTPIILTFPAIASFARAGSDKDKKDGKDQIENKDGKN